MKDINLLISVFPTAPLETNMVCGNVSIVGDEFRSYGVCVARKAQGGIKHAAVTTRKYSVTTSKHTNSVRKALSMAGFNVVNESF